MRLIVATNNPGKLKEIRQILRGIGLPVVSLAKLDKKFNIKENGKTFLANAIKKTKPVSGFYKDDLVVGEDSGLQVEALGGAPGVYSKRYSGKQATDLKNNRKLLRNLEGLPGRQRRARFCCCLVLMRASTLVKAFRGSLPGQINDRIVGRGGFGYDPVFYLPQYKKTVAQLKFSEKNRISHRAQAFRKLRRYLVRRQGKSLTS